MILVTGATGNVGTETVRLLAGQHQRVRALVRDPARLRGVEGGRAGVEVVTGDFDDPGSLDPAMRGIDTVVLVSPAVPHQEIAAIDAAVRAGVTHVIKATSKASADSPVERRRGQAQIEQYLQGTDLAWTLLRSNAYLQNLLALAPVIKQTSGFVMSSGDGQVGMVDARDVAAVAATIATSPGKHAGATYWPTGPALISYTDVAEELSADLGHQIDYRRALPDEHRELMIQAGLPDPIATSNAKAFELIAEGDAAWITDDVHAVTGNPPRDLHTFLADHLAAFR
ncbi:MAG TPA: NmrA family NAD(P)-binding protein [Jatrophihabitantaceae bacterium]|nr:NmrA family NAD(P)-binding protein [Jatrophihabitantaceae bacterium]